MMWNLVVKVLLCMNCFSYVLQCVYVGGVYSASKQNSSVVGGAWYVCLGAVHMEEEVQDRVQVEVGREEQGEGETHGKEQGEEQRATRNNHSQWMTMSMR